MSKVVLNSVVLGQSGTASNNFLLDTDAAGALRIRRNADGSGGTVLNIDSNNKITSGLLTLGTAQNTTSGTSIDFTGIPSWVKRITVMLNGVSSSGTSAYLIRIGSGSFDTTGYKSSGATFTGAVFGSVFRTDGFVLQDSANASDSYSGNLVFVTSGSNVWTMNGNGAQGTVQTGFIAAGSKTLSGTLDRLRLTTVNGTDTFDAGSVNILYEG